MALELTFYDETGKVTGAQRTLLFELLQLAYEELGLSGAVEVSLTIVDDEKIHAINKEYRHVDRATDVISFAINDNPNGDDTINDWPDDLPLELGDLFISIDHVAAQAKEYGHSFERELGFLAVHGFLHLNGFDHVEKEDEKVMFGWQDKILNDYGLTRE